VGLWALTTSRRASRGLGATAAASILLLALSACTASFSSKTTPEPQRSLADYLSAISGGSDESLARVKTAEREIQDSIAECMTAQGFAYTPLDVEAMFGASDLQAMATTAHDFAEASGYGISISILEGAAATGADGRVLSVAEAEAYQTALYGATTGSTAGRTPGSGCDGKARKSVDPVVTVAGSKGDFDDLNVQITQIYVQAEADPRVVTATASWSRCMGGAGYPGLALKARAAQKISEALAELGAASPTGVPAASQLEALQAEERSIATADADCTESTSYADVLRTVQIELESAFVTDHRTELDAMIVAYKTASQPRNPSP
jgi:hypothetical protein